MRDDLTAADRIAAIRDQFTEALGAAGWPDGACLFLVAHHRRRGPVRQPDGAGVIFISPAAIAAVPHLIAVCRAAPGPPPGRTRATLLVGKDSDWDLLPHPTH